MNVRRAEPYEFSYGIPRSNKCNFCNLILEFYPKHPTKCLNFNKIRQHKKLKDKKIIIQNNNV